MSEHVHFPDLPCPENSRLMHKQLMPFQHSWAEGKPHKSLVNKGLLVFMYVTDIVPPVSCRFPK